MPDELITAIALILVIEGGLYALFPEGMRKMAMQIEKVSPSSLRTVGLFAATLGVGIVWLMRS